MSTLSATNIKNASSGSNNIVLGTSGQTTVNGDLLFNSGYGSAATAYGCRAWVNFNGQGTVSADQTIRGSGNVSSVFKTATGIFTINFATAMPDANYSVHGTVSNAPTSTTTIGRNHLEVGPAADQSTTAAKVFTGDTATVLLEDQQVVCVAFFR